MRRFKARYLQKINIFEITLFTTVYLRCMKLYYRPPQASWSDLAPETIICDSYDSGIDDIDYEDVDWTINT